MKLDRITESNLFSEKASTRSGNRLSSPRVGQTKSQKCHKKENAYSQDLQLLWQRTPVSLSRPVFDEQRAPATVHTVRRSAS